MLSIKFYSSSSLAAARRRERSLRMSNGCRGIACRFTHEANFPAYRDAIFLLFLTLFSVVSSRCSYFTFALLSPRILRPFSFAPRCCNFVGIRGAFLPCTDFGCLGCTVTWLSVSALRRAALRGVFPRILDKFQEYSFSDENMSSPVKDCNFKYSPKYFVRQS